MYILQVRNEIKISCFAKIDSSNSNTYHTNLQFLPLRYLHNLYNLPINDTIASIQIFAMLEIDQFKFYDKTRAQCNSCPIPRWKLWILNQIVSAFIVLHIMMSMSFLLCERMKNLELVILECIESLFILPFRHGRLDSESVCVYVCVSECLSRYRLQILCPHCKVCCHRKNLSFHIKLLLFLECVGCLMHYNLLHGNFRMVTELNAFMLKT